MSDTPIWQDVKDAARAIRDSQGFAPTICYLSEEAALNLGIIETGDKLARGWNEIKHGEFTAMVWKS